MLSDVGPLELVTIAVLGVLLFGPDKLPEFLQNVARTVRKIREFSDSAQQEIRSDLGPEFQDFDMRDLHPKTFVRKHVLSGDTDIGREIGELRQALDLRQEPTGSDEAATVSLAKRGASAESTRTTHTYDPDAT